MRKYLVSVTKVSGTLLNLQRVKFEVHTTLRSS